MAQDHSNGGLSLAELARDTGSELRGDPSYRVFAVAAIDQAGPRELSFVHDGRYRSFLAGSDAGAVILPPAMADLFGGNRLLNEDPYLAYARAVELLHPPPPARASIHPSAVIGDGVELGERVRIDAHAVIGNGCRLQDRVWIGPGCSLGDRCRLGEGTVLEAGVALGEGTRIGARCLLHSGAVIGADGFGFAARPDGSWHKIRQIGDVRIGDDVEVGANTCIDRAALGSTLIEQGVKLDNLIQIGHNCHIGADTIVAAHTAIAGTARIGRRCRIGGAVAIAGHLEVADDVTITGNSMVTHSLRQPGTYSSGITAEGNRSWRRNTARFHHLDELFRRVIRLERRLGKE
ncbi:MAG TPA: UDP-3-O-(3-hydroxymyristoyl)glucosamine N-acyltransferase [Sedimenticola thiotaurini]|uniref:UDP-3-O-acylglucosamine N-acyltransferase n=1 Tax=Sedimenticola thiotaurini TaxID=1543721 RepID=A0A831RJG6_9GAMM|nr:UDP-3-O-(3-hydroxymyristoyl)glucosamine N-acyltransferase [Sedimenticola thiotaurini]